MEGNSTKKHFHDARVVLFPLPFQGHVSPMMHLASALQSKGFKITVVLTRFNSLAPANRCSDFDFLIIPDTFSKCQVFSAGLFNFLDKLNSVSGILFREKLTEYMQTQADNISCIIYDEHMYAVGSVAKAMNFPSIILRTCNALTSLARSALLRLHQQGLLPEQGSVLEDELVPDLHPLRFRDLPTSAFGPLDVILEVIKRVSCIRTASAIIYNTATCLEGLSLAQLQQACPHPIFSIGPCHKIIPRSGFSTSLLDEDHSCIQWLDRQKTESVIYVSFGSVALLEEEEFVEMAWGLANSKQPFLWVIRPGLLSDSKWTELQPEGFDDIVAERGCIVKWAPQKEVLAHPAVGAFWSHCGWNSTLESISEGVPMICRPFSGDQKANARLLECVWKIGYLLEGELERGEVEKAIYKVMKDSEGLEMKKRVLGIKQQLDACVSPDGSSWSSLNNLAKFIMSL